MQRKRYLKQKKRSRIGRKLLWFIGISLALVVVALGALRIYAQMAGAPPITIPSASVFLDDEGESIGDHFANERRYWVELEDISPSMIDALISVEDHEFYSHSGFNYKRIIGAIVADIRAGSKVQGASTLTQQFARNLYLSHEKTWTRKLNEALYAYRLEVFYSKDDILEGYLNTVYFGHGMYGIEAASRYYFAKSAKDLTLAEASILAGVPKGPSIYSPIANMDMAKERQQIILGLMEKYGKITAEEKAQAVASEIVLKNDAWSDKNIAPYFLDVAWQEASDILRDHQLDISEGGWQIQTTLNRAHQEAADYAVKNRMPEGDLQAGFVSMRNSTGAVTALVGGRDYATSPFNRVTQAQRQPGSTIKPFLYAAALENGFNPLTFMDVGETTFTYDEGRGSYTPHNVNHKFADHEISLAQALAISDNIYAVKTLDTIGYDAFRTVVKRFDLPISKNNVPTIALGTDETNLYALTAAYNTLASGGKLVKPTTILRITNSNDEVVYEYKTPEQKQALQKEDAFILTKMMTGVFNTTFSDYTPITGDAIAPYLSHEYAAKTGTTDNDQWIVGYSPEITAGVWNGYDEGRALDTSMTKYIWLDFMERASQNLGDKTFPQPKGVEGAMIDIDSGKLGAKACPKQAMIYVKKQDMPTEKCVKFDILDFDTWDSILDILPGGGFFRPDKFKNE